MWYLWEKITPTKRQVLSEIAVCFEDLHKQNVQMESFHEHPAEHSQKEIVQ